MTTQENPVVTLPVLPLRNTVLFPGLFLPLSVGRPSSVAAVEAALAGEEKTFVVVTQKDPAQESPGFDDLYPIGVRAVVRKMARSDSGLELLIQGMEKVLLLKPEQTEPNLSAGGRPRRRPDAGGPEREALNRAARDRASRARGRPQPQVPVNLQQVAAQAGD